MNYSSDLQSARLLLTTTSLMTDEAFAFIHSQCVFEGKLQNESLDEWQAQSFELAFVAARLGAASSLLSSALVSSGKNSTEDKRVEANEGAANALSARVALTNVVRTLSGILGTLAAQAESLGLARERIFAFWQGEEFSQLEARYAGPKPLAALGEELLASGVTRLDPGLSEEQALMRSTFERFTQDVVAPRAEEIHRQDLDIPEEIISAAAQLGCFGTCIPERFGGLQSDDKPDSLSMIIVTEELSRGSLGAAGSLITRPEIAARALLAGGTAEQQQHWLPRLAAGETLCAISITEPNTGSDVASVSLRATRCEGGWRLNGGKTWCTFAGRSQLLVVLARTDPDPSLGYRGLSLFLVEKPVRACHAFEIDNAAGGSLSGRAIATLGYRGMHSFELAFDDYFVPDANLVGGEDGLGKGFYATMAGFAGGRIQTAARASGVMQAAFEAAADYSKQRSTFGKTLAEYQLTQIKIAEMFLTISASRQFSYEVAELMDKGEGQMEASLVKLFSCRAAEQLTREAMQIHGGMGYAEEVAVSRYFVDARVLSIFEGAEEVLALKVVARSLIERAGRRGER